MRWLKMVSLIVPVMVSIFKALRGRLKGDKTIKTKLSLEKVTVEDVTTVGDDIKFDVVIRLDATVDARYFNAEDITKFTEDLFAMNENIQNELTSKNLLGASTNLNIRQFKNEA